MVTTCTCGLPMGHGANEACPHEGGVASPPSATAPAARAAASTSPTALAGVTVVRLTGGPTQPEPAAHDGATTDGGEQPEQSTSTSSRGAGSARGKGGRSKRSTSTT